MSNKKETAKKIIIEENFESFFSKPPDGRIFA